MNTVLIAIIARNKGHFLPLYLDGITNLDYPKNSIHIYIDTNNNNDNTEALLKEWARVNDGQYASIHFNIHQAPELANDDGRPHSWNETRTGVLSKIREASLRYSELLNVDYYFTADCDNIVSPHTLKHLIAQDKPFIAPMLESYPYPYSLATTFLDLENPNDLSGLYTFIKTETKVGTPHFFDIRFRKKIGTFSVAIIHATYLIRKDVISKLSYIDPEDKIKWEYITLCVSAIKNNIDRYVCNERLFGVHCQWDGLTLEEEHLKFSLHEPLIRLRLDQYKNPIQEEHTFKYAHSSFRPRDYTPVQEFLNQNPSIQTIIELGCGPWTPEKAKLFSGKRYLGIDCVYDIIFNNKQYESDHIHFLHSLSEPLLPYLNTDLCITSSKRGYVASKYTLEI